MASYSSSLITVQTAADMIADNDLIVAGIRSYVAQTGTAELLKGMTVGSFSKPVFADLDGDRDLIVGVGDGTPKYYRNTGIISNPTYAAQTGAVVLLMR